jgi:hypothetical protein
MAAKVTFDGIKKLIIVKTGETALDVEVDIYSAWKDWVLSGNAKYHQALRTVGGDPTTGANYIAPYYFLMNGWKIRPYEGHHVLTVDGNLYVDGGGSPFTSTLGSYNVLTQLVLSNNAVTVTIGGSALTTDEHNRLFSLPTVTLESDERTHLLAIPTSADGGLTDDEHDRLFAIPLSATYNISGAGLTTEEHNRLFAIPLSSTSSAGLTDEEHDRLFAIPLSGGEFTSLDREYLFSIPTSGSGLTSAEHDKLMNLNLIQDIFTALGISATGVIVELSANQIPVHPTMAQALMLEYMTKRNKGTSTVNKLEIYNNAGQVILSAAVSDDNITFTKEKFR